MADGRFLELMGLKRIIRLSHEFVMKKLQVEQKGSLRMMLFDVLRYAAKKLINEVSIIKNQCRVMLGADFFENRFLTRKNKADIIFLKIKMVSLMGNQISLYFCNQAE